MLGEDRLNHAYFLILNTGGWGGGSGTQFSGSSHEQPYIPAMVFGSAVSGVVSLHCRRRVGKNTTRNNRYDLQTQ